MTEEIKNIKKAAERIKKAVNNKERIILYGDGDLDGVGSVIILKEAIKNLGGDISAVYFPDREKDGYGISDMGLNSLKNLAPALLISLDCGISNFKQIKSAKKMGFEIMIVDHHPPLDKLPEAKIIVDPRQKTDKYPFKGLANAGLTFKLVEVLLQGKITDTLRKNFLEIVALATIADMVPQEDENLLFIQEGLNSLENSFRPSFKAFKNIDIPIENRKMPLAQIIIQALNATNIKDGISEAYDLLTNFSLEEAGYIAKDLLEKGEEKKAKIRNITEEAENRIVQEKEEPVIFEGDPEWDAVLLGSVASRLCQSYQKPVFVYKKMEKESIGSVRVPKGIDSVASMKKSSKLFITFGGHAPASGFRIKNENLGKLKEELIKYFIKK